MFAKFIHITAAAAIFLSMAGSNSAQEEARATASKTPAEKEIQKSLDKASVAEKSDPLASGKSDSAKPDEKDPVVRRRIVDAKTLEKRQSKVGSFLMKPFRSIAPAVSARITQFEENKEYAILFGPTNLPVSPLFGSVSEGSGVGIGVVATTKDYLSKDFRIFGSSAITTKHYIRNNVGFEITPEKFSKNKLKIKLVAEQLVQPTQHFFGSGIESSQSNETTFFHRQLGAKLSVDFVVNDKLKFGAFSEFTRNDITEGSDSDENVITESF